MIPAPAVEDKNMLASEVVAYGSRCLCSVFVIFITNGNTDQFFTKGTPCWEYSTHLMGPL